MITPPIAFDQRSSVRTSAMSPRSRSSVSARSAFVATPPVTQVRTASVIASA